MIFVWGHHKFFSLVVRHNLSGLCKWGTAVQCHLTECPPSQCRLRRNVSYVYYSGPDSPFLGP
jgi:hypothetical protein